MHTYTYVFLRGKRVHLNFHMHWSTVFKIFPMIFFLFLASDKFCSSCQRMQKEEHGVGGTLSLLRSSPEGDLC